MLVASGDGDAASLSFHGGVASLLLPAGAFVLSVAYVTGTGVVSLSAYFAPLVLVTGVMIFLCRDRGGACAALLDGVADRTLATMLVAFLGAGVLGHVLSASGLVESLAWLGREAGLGGSLLIVLGFLLSAAIATAIGTSTGTCVTVIPVLYPAGVALGADPALLLGAIYSGARFGDNLAPISDTTVASAYTQGVEVGQVVRNRLKYALAAGALSIVLYVIAAAVIGSSQATVSPPQVAATHEAIRLQSLWLLVAPILTIGMCIRRRPLIEALWSGIFAAVALGLLSGSLDVSRLYAISPPRAVGGALSDGVLAMRDVMILAIMIMGLVGLLRSAGVLTIVGRHILRFAKSVRRAELSIFVLVSLMCPLLAGNTPAMLFSGPVAREIGERYGIPPARRANLMDLAANGVTENMPHINTMLALAGAMILAHETSGAPIVSVLEVGLLAFHPMALSLVAIVAIYTGCGAERG